MSEQQPHPGYAHDPGCAYAAQPDTATCDCSVREYWQQQRDSAANQAFGAMVRQQTGT